jgi:hypothetical protein
VVLRDAAGRVLYRSDPVTNTTIMARDVQLPIVTVKPEPVSPAVEQPLDAQQSTDRPRLRERKGPPLGCEGVVSALADRDASRPPGLCLAQQAGRGSA